MAGKSTKIKTLPELDEDALIEVFKYLDLKSLLSTMATCKKFEGIIGNRVQFYEKFRLRLGLSVIKHMNEELLRIRRRFGIVEIGNMQCCINNKFYQCLLNIIHNIGPQVIDLKILNCTFTKHEASFVNLMKLFRNVKKISLNQLNFESRKNLVSYKDDPSCQFKQLKSLEFCNLKNEEILAKVFFLDSLDHFRLSSSEEWSTHQQILLRIKQLRSLEFDGIRFDNFECPADFCLGIQKLRMRFLRFSNEKALSDFTKFIKNEKNIMEVVQHVDFEKNRDIPDEMFSDLFLQLFSKPSLETLHISLNNSDPSAIFHNLKVQNPTVKKLIVNDYRSWNSDYVPAYIERYFPKLGSLMYLKRLLQLNDHLPLNFSELTELNIEKISASSLRYIKVKQLRKFTFKLYGFDMDIASLQCFADNHCDLEYLDASFWHIYHPDINRNSERAEYETEYYRLIIEGFPKLKALKLRRGHQLVEKTDLIIEMFEKYADGLQRLDYLELNLFHEESNERIRELFQRICPEFSCNFENLRYQGSIGTFKKRDTQKVQE